jgi:hypothetical protein
MFKHAPNYTQIFIKKNGDKYVELHSNASYIIFILKNLGHKTRCTRSCYMVICQVMLIIPKVMGCIKYIETYFKS